MSSPPEVHGEYSRGSGPFRRLLTPVSDRAAEGPAGAADERTAGTGAVVLVALVGALLVLFAQFVALYNVRVVTNSSPVKAVGTGANHGWAPLPIALVCLVLVLAVFRYGSRAALLGLVALGIATLLIALAVDLPDVHATGLIGSSAGRFQRAANSPAAGLYLETLGSVLLLASGGVGFLMLGGGSTLPARLGGAWASRSAKGTEARAPATASPATASPPAAGPTSRTGVEARERSPDPAAPDPADAGPAHPPPGDPGGPAPPDTGPKNPPSLGDKPRRRWSVS